MTILTHIIFAIFLISLTPGARGSIIINHRDLSYNRTRNKMNGGKKVF